MPASEPTVRVSAGAVSACGECPSRRRRLSGDRTSRATWPLNRRQARSNFAPSYLPLTRELAWNSSLSDVLTQDLFPFIATPVGPEQLLAIMKIPVRLQNEPPKSPKDS